MKPIPLLNLGIETSTTESSAKRPYTPWSEEKKAELRAKRAEDKKKTDFAKESQRIHRAGSKAKFDPPEDS